MNSLCPRFEKGMQLLGRRWTGLIIHQLLPGPQRFCTIESALPISAKLLSERLKELEQENIVRRDVYPDTPVRIEYSLTAKGLALQTVIHEIEKWSSEWIELDEETD
ncbi:winged helix-turn-helix transcriptional regulator [Brevibacillus fulvus]|uniref:DNA-binding HxlR family transcriptional regulator n=1 Tax=Brevibacillus fulvus TaxID=1125967 RepID=A0A939BVE5_9BACL|nr:winged helix-turn-helix transcriptional regulator [Brevibacillus fulvus]MBM7591394.1 DNA-binding HxlR family transcriptional regulator [Brevibacillus fulvus]